MAYDEKKLIYALRRMTHAGTCETKIDGTT